MSSGSPTESDKIRAMQEWIDKACESESPDDLDAAAELDPEFVLCRDLLLETIQNLSTESLLTSLRDIVLHGSGTYGIVFAGVVAGGKRVAIKVLRPSAQASRSAFRRFQLEGEALQRCRFPGIVPVLEVGQVADLPYIIMEFAEGGNLAERIAEMPSPIPARQTAELMISISETLHRAHQQGIIHRDLKPSNILFDARPVERSPMNRAMICDFGLVRDMSRSTKITMTGTSPLVGTVAYMSPEQALGRSWETTTASDVFSLGVLLFELLTLRRPFEGESRVEILYRIAFSEPLPIRGVNPSIPRELAAIVEKCLAKQPQDRYPSAAEFAADLNAWRSGKPISAQQASSIQRLATWTARNPKLAVLCSLLGVILVSASIVSGVLYSRARVLLLESDRQRARADGNMELALKAVTDMGQYVAEEVLLDVPRSNEKRLDIHMKSLAFFRSFAEQANYDAKSMKRLAVAYHYAASAAHQVPGNEELEIELRQSEAQLLQRLIEQEPDNANLHFSMFHNRLPLGISNRNQDFLLEAETYVRRAIALAPLRDEFSDALATLLVNLAEGEPQDEAKQQRDLSEAIETARRNLDRHPEKISYWKPLIHAHLCLAKLALEKMEYSLAIRWSQEALQICNDTYLPVDEPYSRMTFQIRGYHLLAMSQIANKDTQALLDVLPQYIERTTELAQQQTKYGREVLSPIHVCLQAAELFFESNQPARVRECLQSAVDLSQLKALLEVCRAEEIQEIQEHIGHCKARLYPSD